VISEIVANVIASAILTVLAFVPLVNLWVGTVVGASFGGPLGFFAGALAAVLITMLEMAILRLMEEDAPAAEVRTRAETEESQHTASSQVTGVGRLQQAIISLADWKLQKAAAQARHAVGSAFAHGRARRRAAA
jgi:hypothetical protein